MSGTNYNCNFCSSCESCSFCYLCDSCKNLKMTESNYFCWSEKYNDDKSFQQPRYRVFNTQVTKDEYYAIEKIYHDLDFDPNESHETRFSTAFKKMWNNLTEAQQQEYLDIPHFNWEGFTYITGVTPDMVKDKKAETPEMEEMKRLHGELMSAANKLLGKIKANKENV